MRSRPPPNCGRRKPGSHRSDVMPSAARILITSRTGSREALPRWCMPWLRQCVAASAQPTSPSATPTAMPLADFVRARRTSSSPQARFPRHFRSEPPLELASGGGSSSATPEPRTHTAFAAESSHSGCHSAPGLEESKRGAAFQDAASGPNRPLGCIKAQEPGETRTGAVEKRGISGLSFAIHRNSDGTSSGFHSQFIGIRMAPLQNSDGTSSAPLQYSRMRSSSAV